MPAINTISIDKLARLIGTPACPTVIDIRTDADIAADPRSIPGARRRAAATVADWAGAFAGQSTLVACEAGGGPANGRSGGAAAA